MTGAAHLILLDETPVAPAAGEADRVWIYAATVQWPTLASRRHPLVVDSLLAAALFGIGALGGRGGWDRFLLFAVMCGALAFRRRAPLTVFLVVAATGFAQYLLMTGLHPADVVILVAMYSVAAHRGRREALFAFAVVELGIGLAAYRWSAARDWWSVVIALTVVAAAGVLLGETMRVRRAYLTELEERAARLERERDQEAKIAVAAERQRIARELHDIVAHNVSVMVAQADGAGFAMEKDPEAARAAMAVVAETGREALTEMRRLLGVLRDAEMLDGTTPQPGVEQIGELVDRVRATGLTVDLELQGQPRPMAPGLQLAAYRIVQEALTNTIKHAGRTARARVALTYADSGIELRVEDDGPAAPYGRMPAVAGSGQGVVGMRERAAIYGGDVSVGSRVGGGYEVVASFPLAGSTS
ncbi:MAG: integral rane sensor signal transduction histidine kinase [Actinomycetia bacterium]|nr:integral rane sensor signal transduction histidine kinase [Actinomycetes bacterium]